MKDTDIYLWGKPVNYKGIDFYPLKIDEYDWYQLVLKLLSYSKNSINDINILHMSYLKFMVYVLKYDEIDMGYLLCQLLSRVTKKELSVENNLKQKIMMHDDGTIHSLDDILDVAITIDNVTFNQSDFENIREIILEENGISLKIINQYDPTLEDKLVYMQKGIEPLEFEEQVFSFCAYMKLSLNEVKNYTFYQFKKIKERINLIDNYEIFKPLEASGQISYKDGTSTKHWMSHISEPNRYDDILVSKEKFIDDNDFFKVSGDLNQSEIVK